MTVLLRIYKKEAFALIRILMIFGLVGWLPFFAPELGEVVYQTISDAYVAVSVWVGLTLIVFYTLEKVLKINQEKKFITTLKGNEYKFDHVIIATHTDSAKKILRKISLEQRQLLNMVKYRGNTAIMHTDTSVMPRNKYNWSSWNFIYKKKPLL